MEYIDISTHECSYCGYIKTLSSHSSSTMHTITGKRNHLQGAKVCSRHLSELGFSPTRQLNANANSLNNLEVNQDTEINQVFEDQKFEKPKQFNDEFVNFLKSNYYMSETVPKSVIHESSYTQMINSTSDENSRIDFHNQPSTSKQLFTIIEPTFTAQSVFEKHYCDIEPSWDNQEQGFIKRQRLN